MKLHAMNGKPPVGKAHDFLVVGPGCHLKLLGQARPLDGQGVITGNSERIIEPNKHASANMLDLRCLAIRTGILKDKTLYVSAGAGIVADSVPESEWKETETKARAVLHAAEIAERGLEP